MIIDPQIVADECKFAEKQADKIVDGIHLMVVIVKEAYDKALAVGFSKEESMKIATAIVDNYMRYASGK